MNVLILLIDSNNQIVFRVKQFVEKISQNHSYKLIQSITSNVKNRLVTTTNFCFVVDCSRIPVTVNCYNLFEL